VLELGVAVSSGQTISLIRAQPARTPPRVIDRDLQAKSPNAIWHFGTSLNFPDRQNFFPVRFTKFPVLIDQGIEP
jgi:hypothetical protein